jgi:hypothetical protein
VKIIDEVVAWFRDPQLEIRHAIVIAAIIVTLGLVVGVILAPKEVWLALTAIGTIGVVAWAVFHEWFLTKRKRPILELSLFESTSPPLLEIPEINHETGDTSRGYYVTLKLINTGRSVAKNTQPQITRIAQYMYDNGWQIQHNWVPVSITWILDEWTRVAEGKPTEERDLISERPYLFHALGIGSTQPDLLNIYPTVIPRHQRDKYAPGEYCFEITVFALGAETIKKYVHTKWKQEEPDTFASIPDRLEVSLRDDWPFEQVQSE